MDTQEILEKATSYLPSREDCIKMIGLVDLTSLEGKDTEEDIRILSEKAMKNGVAAVCVYPTLVAVAKKALSGSQIRSACVAGGFPGGQTSLHIKEEEVKFALDEGADEIDMVINRGKFLEREYGFVADEISSLKALCGTKTLKVILETGELKTPESIARASAIAIKAGADFVKTSTGKISVGATPEAILAMIAEVKKQVEQTGKRIGIKPSGGIPDARTASLYYQLVKTTLGTEWMQPTLFRFGASRLVDALSAAIHGTSGPQDGHGY